MTVETKPMLPAITPSGEPWEPKTLEVLEAYPEQKFNLLLPTVQVRQVNPYLVPDIEVVQLKKSDIYTSRDMKGAFAPTANGLGKLADVAGITVLDSRRMDDGKDPDVVEWRVEIEMISPGGRPRRAMGSKRIDLHQLGATQTPQWLAKAREHLVANAETKALNRALRGVLSLHGSYPESELLKPFAVLRYVPDMSQPEVRQAFLGQLVPTTEKLYGPLPGDAAKQLTNAEPEVAPEAPEEDPAPARDDVDADGVKIEEPDWGSTTDATADAKPEVAPEPRILIALRERAEASDVKGAPADELRKRLRSATPGIGNEAVMIVLAALWDIKQPSEITAAQAHAILDESEQRGRTFAADWREAAAWLKDGAS